MAMTSLAELLSACVCVCLYTSSTELRGPFKSRDSQAGEVTCAFGDSGGRCPRTQQASKVVSWEMNISVVSLQNIYLLDPGG